MTVTDAVATGAFAGMTILAAAVSLAKQPRSRARSRQLLIAWVVGATLLAGLSQRNLWPLSSWSLMTGSPRRDMGVQPPYLRLVLVDRDGREYPLDYRAVEPFAFEELMAWMRIYFLELSAAERDSAGQYLLAVANAARARVAAGESPGRQGRWLGPLRAPFHTLHPRRWEGSATVPADPFVALRLYGETWDLLERARDPARVNRQKLYEYFPGGGR